MYQYCVVPEITHLKDSSGEGDSKAKGFNGEYEFNLEFPEGWEGSNQTTFHGKGVGIFWKHLMHNQSNP